MGSSRTSDRSLNSEISFSQWMRRKVDTRFDFDQGVLSPPSHDDTFFYIRYQRPRNISEQFHEGLRSVNELSSDNQTSISTATPINIPEIKNTKDIDFSNHPAPCQPFVPAAHKNHEKRYNIQQKPLTKSQGVDDGFHGEPALCGKSIVDVASRIMWGSFSKKWENQQQQQQQQQATMMSDKEIHKKSRSLPVSPITSPSTTPEGSPKSGRRTHGNRYFTGAFIPDKEKYQGGWFLSSILSQSREVISSKIEEEDEVATACRALNRKKSISSQNLSYIGKEDSSPKKNITEASVTFQAKPSELREINFWSPTSM